MKRVRPFLWRCRVQVQRCRDALGWGKGAGVGGWWRENALKGRVCRRGREICGVYETVSTVRIVSITVNKRRVSVDVGNDLNLFFPFKVT